ncbi:methylcitrate synthase [Clostridiales bacterium CHKCI001]|nr:methylcitrate synthase [Clostridiales bacterium CHKCI001]
MIENLNQYVQKQADICFKNDKISPRLYKEYGVNLGLRDVNGKGVLTGLTNISKIVSSKAVDGRRVPCDGELWYRGYNVKDLIQDLGKNEFGFEKIAYLLLMGELPNKKDLQDFCEVIGKSRILPTNFTRDVIMKAPSSDIMNTMTRSILTLASYDKLAKDTNVDNSLR